MTVPEVDLSVVTPCYSVVRGSEGCRETYCLGDGGGDFCRKPGLV